jgi:hypothetical protein
VGLRVGLELSQRGSYLCPDSAVRQKKKDNTWEIYLGKSNSNYNSEEEF